MLDRSALSLLAPLIKGLARACVRLGLSANQLTWLGFFIGLGAAVCVSQGDYWVGLGLLLISRLMDGIDGTVARSTAATDFGGFLDITLDFLFYASMPLAFAYANPSLNALAAATLLAAIMGTASSFLAFASIAAKRGLSSGTYPNKSIYYLGGLTEGTETIVCFCAMCLWPTYFAFLAYGFAALCCITIATRIYSAWRQLR